MEKSSLHTALMVTHLQDDNDETLVNFLSTLRGPEEILPLAFSLKDEGNVSFKTRKFDVAARTYSKALKLLCFCWPLKPADEATYQDLVFALNLNLAACGLKLGDCERAKSLCSLVLEFDPANVKALFRQAVASINLGNFQEAHSYLVKASTIEPHNSDIQKELGKIEARLRREVTDTNSMVTQGKRPLDAAFEMGPPRKGKHFISQSHEGETSSRRTTDHFHGPSSAFKISSTPANVQLDIAKPEGEIDGVHNMDKEVHSDSPTNMHVTSPAVKDANSRSGHSKHALEFVNRKRNHSIKVPRQLYEKILDGHEVDYFQPFSMTRMTIRVYKTPKITDEEMSCNSCSDSVVSSVASNCNDQEMENVSNIKEFAQDTAVAFPTKDLVELESRSSYGLINDTFPCEVDSMDVSHSSDVQSVPFVFSSRPKTRPRKARLFQRFKHKCSASTKHRHPKAKSYVKAGSSMCFHNGFCVCRCNKSRKRMGLPHDFRSLNNKKYRCEDVSCLSYDVVCRSTSVT